MTTSTMHMGGYAAGAARPGAGCSALVLYVGTTLPSIAFPWHDTVSGKQVDPVFATDRPARRPLERFP